ncbi:MAG TPA: TadE family type IV pilus minor pilin [Mycobacteriales bacterium]|nr:TadE family type IV pilus minor pilin [Mycobacteriales bacterium]
MRLRPGRGRIPTAGPAQHRSGEAGMVTAELAVALPALVLVLVAALYGVALITAQLRCVDAAAVGARLAARGETGQLARSTALDAAPAGAGLEISRSATVVTATVTVRVAPLGLSRLLPGVTVAGHASDDVETTDSPP